LYVKVANVVNFANIANVVKVANVANVVNIANVVKGRPILTHLSRAWSFSQKSFNQGKSLVESQCDQIRKNFAVCAKSFLNWAIFFQGKNFPMIWAKF
jgi:hypothetical protein